MTFLNSAPPTCVSQNDDFFLSSVFRILIIAQGDIEDLRKDSDHAEDDIVDTWIYISDPSNI